MRLVRWQRIGLRVLGVFVSLFGLGIFAAALGGFLKAPVFDAVSGALLARMWFCVLGRVVFFGGVLFVVQSIRGWSVDRPRLLRRGAELGPMAVFPPGTPAMEKEARSFNVAFRALLGTAVRAGLYHG